MIPQIKEITYTGNVAFPGIPVIKEYDTSFEREEYAVSVKCGSVTLKARDDEGIFRAEMILKQLFAGGYARTCELRFRQEFTYRSFMIDSARHMQTVDEIKKMVASAALFGYNVFHWHLCDDQGFRIEMKDLPVLNTVGSYREKDRFGKIRSDERYGGYYTEEEIRDIVAFCAERFITVVPEIDMPGHTTAIISAIPEISCEQKQIPLRCGQGIFPEILCAGNEETFGTIFRILDTVAKLFPGEYVHIGGDEAPKKKWDDCAKCRKRIKDEGLKNSEELQGYFMNRVAAYLGTLGKKTVAWNESLNSGILDSGIIVQKWMRGEENCARHTERGGKIICSDFGYVYLDYPYGMTPLDKVFFYDPFFRGCRKENVLGFDTPLWTEYITDFARLTYLAYPRMCAVACLSRTRKTPADYAAFRRDLRRILPLLGKEYGITAAPEKDFERTRSAAGKAVRFLVQPQIMKLFDK